ncbi:hypothetical protein HLB23_39330 [Nocardia uniformis]|uniref:Uncharacterized protein n=1 Tax=Nocardia uniformis TaxID=53432 RepID=A0A849CG13_9NOCA|nr:hypothetical protein [Nocardia uniformis]NNH75840.1 hypothetical protein [Nocardia uniformis]
MRTGRVVACEWCARLDAEAPVEVRGEADAVVVIAIAPQRLAHPVTGRALVICEFLETKGFRVEAVHVRALREGALWTTLRGGVGGIVPAPRSSAPQPRLPFSGAALMSSRWLMAACAVLAALMFAAPAPAAPPEGQPGLITEPHSGGQAGVAVPPHPAAPAVSADGGQASPAGVSAEPLSYPQPAQAIPASPRYSVPQANPVPSQSAESTAVGQEVAADRDIVRLGAAELPRPDWLPAPIAAHERDWNAFLTGRGAAAADHAGLTDPAIDASLGVTSDEQVPPPQELVLAQAVAADPQMLVPAVTEVAEPLRSEVAAAVPEIATPVADLLGAALTPQPPA